MDAETFMYRAKELCRELGRDVPYLLPAYLDGWRILGIGLEFSWRRLEFILRHGGSLQDLDEWLRQRRAERILAERRQSDLANEAPEAAPEPAPHPEPLQRQPASKADKVRQLLRETVGRGPIPAIKLQRLGREAGLLRADQEIGRCSTFRRVAKELGIQSRRSGYGPGTEYIWRQKPLDRKDIGGRP